MAFYIPYAIITSGLYSGVVSTIGTVTVGTCKLIKSMYTQMQPDVARTIKELDIERKLRVVQSVINSIQHNSDTNETKLKLNDLEKTQIFETMGHETDLDRDPIEISLNYLKQTIQDIQNDLSAINQKLARHKKKWFNSWRTLTVKPLLDNLTLNAKILDLRYDDLTKIFLFLKNKNK